jgi:hypothetical protein
MSYKKNLHPWYRVTLIIISIRLFRCWKLDGTVLSTVMLLCIFDSGTYNIESTYASNLYQMGSTVQRGPVLYASFILFIKLLEHLLWILEVCLESVGERPGGVQQLSSRHVYNR